MLFFHAEGPGGKGGQRVRIEFFFKDLGSYDILFFVQKGLEEREARELG